MQWMKPTCVEEIRNNLRASLPPRTEAALLVVYSIMYDSSNCT